MPRYFAGLLALAIFGGCGGAQSSGGPSNGGSSGASASGGTAGSSGGAGGSAATAGVGGIAGGGQGGTAGSDGGVQDSGSGDAIADAPFDASKNYQAWADYCTVCSLTNCMDTIDCYEGWFTEEVVTAYVACRTASCSTSDDPCAASAQASIPVTTAGTDLFNTCQAKVSSCGGTLTFPCAASFFSSVLPSIQTSYKSCFAGPCADVKACLQAARPAACNG